MDKLKKKTIGDWLRSLPDEELVKYLDWACLCPDPEKCPEVDSCECCATKRLKQEYTGGNLWEE